MTGSPSDPQPGWGAPGGWQQPPSGSGGWGGTGWGGAPGPAGRPPLRSGLIELRPLTLSDFLDNSFRVIQRNPKATLGLALIVQLAVAVIVVVVQALLWQRFAPDLEQFMTDVGQGDTSAVLPGGAVGALGGYSALSGLASLLGQAVVNGLMIVAVSRAILAERPGPDAVWRTARPRLGALIGWAVLTLLVPALGISAVVLLAVLVGTASPAAGAALGVFGVLAATVVVIWAGIRLLVVAPALVLEQVPLRRAIGRSWSLTRGAWWRLLGVYLLSSILVYAIVNLVLVPVSLIGGAVAAASGDTAPGGAAMLVVSGISTVLSGIGYAYLAAVVSLQYIDLRIRREGLDVQLAAEIERRAQA